MTHPDLMVGTATSDDAGVFRIAPDRALVQTVDFFTPIVDDPRDWGRIAAANALSDIYAMGAVPSTALQLVGWPRGDLPFEILSDVLRGGADVMADAGCVIVGGHSIDDTEPTYGFAVTGMVHPDHVIANRGATSGDRLVLTKPLGTGIIATAVKAGACDPHVLEMAVDSMAQLNAAASEAMRDVGVHAATDVTGFGLLGHLREILVASGVAATVEVGAVPILPGAWELLDAGFYPGGSGRNGTALADSVDGGDDRSRRMLWDAQTSGGLLISVPADRSNDLMETLAGHGTPSAVIGHITTGPIGRISLEG